MLMEGGGKKEDYILIYHIYGFEDKESKRKFYDYARKLSDKTGLEIVQIAYNFAEKLKAIFERRQDIVLPDVFRFISLIDNARYVLTDSFHGTAFSLNLNTEPICIYPQKFTTRIESILRLTHTLHRHIESYDDFDVLNRPVNFDEVNQILNSERKKASDWLKMVLSEIREYNA